MDGLTASGALLKAIASYGVLGLGWIAWILTMVYLQAERKRYQGLVIHIIQYFTKVNSGDHTSAKILGDDDDDKPKSRHQKTFNKLFGTD